MNFNYAATASTAVKLLTRFGAAATLRRTTPAAYNPATGTSAPTVTDFATVAAVFAYPQKYVDGTLIKQGDQQAYCSPAVVPAQGDVLAWQGVEYQVVAVKPVSPAGIPVLFEAQLRG